MTTEPRKFNLLPPRPRKRHKRYLSAGQWLGTSNQIKSMVFNNETGGWEALTSAGAVHHQKPVPPHSDSPISPPTAHTPNGLRTWDAPTDGRIVTPLTPWPPAPSDYVPRQPADDERPVLDAWELQRNLQQATTRSWEVRSDISVDALGADRCVRLTITERPSGEWDIPTVLAVRQGNVITMRELAQTILAACDFVEEINPTWAEGISMPVQDPDAFLVGDDDDDDD